MTNVNMTNSKVAHKSKKKSRTQVKQLGRPPISEALRSTPLSSPIPWLFVTVLAIGKHGRIFASRAVFLHPMWLALWGLHGTPSLYFMGQTSILCYSEKSLSGRFL